MSSSCCNALTWQKPFIFSRTLLTSGITSLPSTMTGVLERFLRATWSTARPCVRTAKPAEENFTVKGYLGVVRWLLLRGQHCFRSYNSRHVVNNKHLSEVNLLSSEHLLSDAFNASWLGLKKIIHFRFYKQDSQIYAWIHDWIHLPVEMLTHPNIRRFVNIVNGEWGFLPAASKWLMIIMRH